MELVTPAVLPPNEPFTVEKSNILFATFFVFVVLRGERAGGKKKGLCVDFDEGTRALSRIVQSPAR